MTMKGTTMKVRADRAELARAATWVGQALSKRPAAPALAGIKLQAEADVLTLSAFDYGTAHSAQIACEVGDAGECLVSGKFLREIVASIRGKEIELTLDAARLAVTSGRSSYRIGAMRLDDYPALPTFPAQVGTVARDDLAEILAAVEHAASRDDTVPILTAVNLCGRVGIMQATATDRFRIARASTMWSVDGATGSDPAMFEANVPVSALTTALKDMSGPLQVGADGHMLGLSDGTRTVTTRLLAGDFPSLDRHFSAEADGTYEVDADELAGALKRAALVNEANAALRVEITPTEITLAADSEAGEGTEVVECEGDGEISMLFNPAFLAEALSAVGGRVRLGTTTALKPISIHPTDGRHVAVVVMPRRKM